tara:strand:- start:38 stop:295 length:258 start_codon:yes stop_codon:yes gene_type:complete
MPPAEPQNNSGFSVKDVKEWLTFVIAIIVAVSGIIFWVQSVGNDQIEGIEEDVSFLKVEMKEIQKQNGEILRLIGKLEGKLEAHH